ncbi:sodium:proton antiporter [Janibacter cremeus]|uniref:cation:proton antiporter n=1 Tax=Janibacter cremeus TaxID=1285192 RepID=UPI0023F93A82|nr:sodium:proton antiporter [Janibacter cremeus]WEV79520.1 sodium:proton antiporter [Janibacter cremeus]
MISDPASYLALVTALGVACQVLAWAVRIPSILVLLIVGFGLGQVVTADAVLGRDVLFSGVTLAVGIILFEGSLSLRLSDISDLGRSTVRLCTVTVAIAWALITLTGWLLGFPLELALLVGAVLVVTGPTVIGPILRQLRPTRRIAALLRWEGIVVDPIGAILAVLVFQAVLARTSADPVSAVLTSLGTTIVTAVLIALVLGVLLEQAIKRHLVPDFLHGAVFLAAAVGAFALSNSIESESGLLTVTIMGVFLANRPNLHLEHVTQFKEHLQVLLVGILFIVLAGRVSPEAVVEIAPVAAVFVLALVLVVRPLSVFLGLVGTGATKEERRLLAFMAPRGIVAAAVVSIFALELAHAAERASDPEHAARLEHLGTEAARMVPLVFLVIVATVAIYGLGVGRLAERLGLATTSPQGVILAGGDEWIVRVAKALDDVGVDVVIVTVYRAALQRARMAGMRVEMANLLSDYVVRDMDLAGLKTFVAATDQDERNTIAAREFSHFLGRAHVFQLAVAPAEHVGADRTETASHLTARTPFAPALEYKELTERAKEMDVRRTSLTAKYTYEDFRRMYGGRAIALFAVRGREVAVVTEKSSLEGELTLISLVPRED